MTSTQRIHDVIVVGGGIVGLATAYQLLRARPGLKLTLLEKESELATHQTGRNSGVVHAGIYYAPGSLKARLCTAGKQELEAFCAEHEIAVAHVGKLIVALDESELPRLATLYERAQANGVPGVVELDADGLREKEPHAAGIRAVWSPATGITDFGAVAEALADEIRRLGGEVRIEAEVVDIRVSSSGVECVTRVGPPTEARFVITCGGVESDRLASLTGQTDIRIAPFRGDYYTLAPEARDLVRGLIYPVPDPRFPFLGIHLTRRIDGEVWAGPNAVLAIGRYGYRRRDLDLRELWSLLAHPGFRKLAAKYWRTGGAEMWRDWVKAAFTRAVQRYVPAIEGRHLALGRAGIRAQALRRDGTLVDDFELVETDRVLHVVNAPSPAATASLAIGRHLAERAGERFGLGS